MWRLRRTGRSPPERAPWPMRICAAALNPTGSAVWPVGRFSSECAVLPVLKRHCSISSPHAALPVPQAYRPARRPCSKTVPLHFGQAGNSLPVRAASASEETGARDGLDQPPGRTTIHVRLPGPTAGAPAIFSYPTHLRGMTPDAWLVNIPPTLRLQARARTTTGSARAESGDVRPGPLRASLRGTWPFRTGRTSLFTRQRARRKAVTGTP